MRLLAKPHETSRGPRKPYTGRSFFQLHPSSLGMTTPFSLTANPFGLTPARHLQSPGESGRRPLSMARHRERSQSVSLPRVLRVCSSLLLQEHCCPPGQTSKPPAQLALPSLGTFELDYCTCVCQNSFSETETLLDQENRKPSDS